MDEKVEQMEEQLKEPERVKLPRLRGISPDKYLPVFYGIGVVLILLALLLLPGLVKTGERVTITSRPAGALIKIDNKIVGSSPLKIFLSPGDYEVTLSRPYFDNESRQIHIRSPRWGTLFFHGKREEPFSLFPRNPRGLIADAAYQWSRWGLIRDFSTTPLPPVLREVVREWELFPEWKDQLIRLLDYALLFCDSPGEWAEIQEAWSFLEEDRDLTRRLEDLLASPEMVRYFTLYLEGNLEDDELPGEKKPSSPGKVDFLNRMSIGGLSFVYLPPGDFTYHFNKYSALDLPGEGEGIYAAETAVESALFREFTEDVPRWRKSNREALEKEELVTASYLEAPAEKGYPLTDVSFFAAQAFCEWFSEKYAPPGFKARLPFSREYDMFQDYSFFPGMDDGIWEWCSDWFFPMRFFFSSSIKNVIMSFPSAPYLKAVRGAMEFEALSTGSRVPGWCDVNTGFRIILEKEREG